MARVLAGIIPGLLIATAVQAAPVLNGFDLAGALVPVDEIHRGGPPRDGIPAIEQPRFTSPRTADFLEPDDRVLGYAGSDRSRAYPVPILNWHEIVNDQAGGHGLLVTYCPLCGTGMAFRVPESDSFGVSGLLYNSDVLMYDHATESLWSQIRGQAVTGPRKGEDLEQVVLEHTTWARWREQHPDTHVLAPPPRSTADYDVDPYAGYERSRKIYFPVAHRDRSLHPKERVLGVEIDGEARAWSLKVMDATDSRLIEDRLAGERLRIHYDPEGDSARVERVVETGEAGSAQRTEPVAGTIGYWFAWYAFHPDTSIWRPEDDSG